MQGVQATIPVTKRADCREKVSTPGCCVQRFDVHTTVHAVDGSGSYSVGHMNITKVYSAVDYFGFYSCGILVPSVRENDLLM